MSVGNYKRTVKRIEDGHRLCNDMMSCIQERAKIEKAYAQQLTDWSKRWRQLVERGPQYGTLERAWVALMTEAEKVSELHQEVKNNLLNEDLEKVKNWQKEAYHKQMMGGFKETKEAEEGFRKAQKPWAKKLKEVKRQILVTHFQLMIAIFDVLINVHQRIKDAICFVFQAKEKYEKSLDELSKCTPQYMENMEVVFEQCQQFEEKRLNFLREVFLDIKRHLNLTESQSYAAVYRELERTIASASAQEDLKLFSNVHGPGMHMNWPQFEEFNPELSHSINKKEKVKRNHDGVTLTQVTHGTILSFSHLVVLPSVSSSEKNQQYSAEWSDDEQPPAAQPASETNGGENPFEEESKGVRVRALYDYEGQEQDELTFKAGEELTKLEDEDEQGWCRGRLDSGQRGLYPANYVEPV
uniref:Protein kinase C and casein kinase substrate in neurons 1b n=1 Tax=Sinocyclocheilus rhinocerous TaxID=307959 RepID=A0A673JA22_9TELE